MKKHFMVALTGVFVGLAAVALVKFGNPGNMGFCIACFLRDIAGALKLHNAAVVQYIRPEVIGLVLGAFAIAFVKKEFKPRGGCDDRGADVLRLPVADVPAAGRRRFERRFRAGRLHYRYRNWGILP